MDAPLCNMGRCFMVSNLTLKYLLNLKIIKKYVSKQCYGRINCSRRTAEFSIYKTGDATIYITYGYSVNITCGYSVNDFKIFY